MILLRTTQVLAAAATLALLGCASMGGSGATTPHVVSTTTTTQLNHALRKRTPVATFSLEDGVVCIVDFAWDDVTRPAGAHSVQWRWYKEGTLVSQSEKEMYFKTSPFSTWTTRAATSLGPGQFRVDTLLDERVASSCEFQIRPP
jgi:hypothetical protein